MSFLSKIKNEAEIKLPPKAYAELFVNLCNFLSFKTETFKCQEGCSCELCKFSIRFLEQSFNLLAFNGDYIKRFSGMIDDLIYLSTKLVAKTHKKPEEYVLRVLANHRIFEEIPWETLDESNLSANDEPLFNDEDNSWWDTEWIENVSAVPDTIPLSNFGPVSQVGKIFSNARCSISQHNLRLQSPNHDATADATADAFDNINYYPNGYTVNTQFLGSKNVPVTSF